MNPSRRNAVLMLTLVCLLFGCLAPDTAYLMDQNRSGKWATAERVGKDMLANPRTFTHSQICETYYQVAYALTRQGKLAEAKLYMADLDRIRPAAPLDPKSAWLGRETARLKRELGLLDPTQELIVAALEANAAKDVKRARTLVAQALAIAGATDAERATAHFLASICALKMGDLGEAKTEFSAYERFKPSLSPDSEALAEEASVRQALAPLGMEK